MKKLVVLLMAVTLFFSCSEEKRRRGIDFSKLKAELNLTDAQVEKYDAVVASSDEERQKQMEEMKASGKMNRKGFMKIMKTSYTKQEAAFKDFLNEEQQVLVHEFIKKNMPGQSDYSDELKAEIIQTLALDSAQTVKYKAVNQAFAKAFRDAHDHYHGNGEAANMYWNQFNEDRKTALQKIFTEEQYAQYLELIKKENYRGKNERG
ncbi:hypothetical protein [Flammeovirga sp. SJP92]|uniref:hypothetical protein n=1 Tax=Flammeovirga sp. SJP92 TaxID=1775430 RepID=UPI000793E4A1|nr:hypothetical protein [Flammeovirga sp. SJP92]KXX67582.1 hypothetical protein AVL50_26340 [Flammeovirga sp. SJP92]